jgi:hypothetical protein
VTADGRRLARRATKTLGEVRFGVDQPDAALQQLVDVLQAVRAAAE